MRLTLCYLIWPQRDALHLCCYQIGACSRFHMLTNADHGQKRMCAVINNMIGLAFHNNHVSLS